MSVSRPEDGEVLSLVRVLSCNPDPIRLFEALTNGGRGPNTLLLESGDASPAREASVLQGEKSLLIPRSALCARCRGRQVEIVALSPNGLNTLPWLARRLRDQAVVEQKEDRLLVTYPPPPPGDDDFRLQAPSPVDVLRILARGFGLLSGQAAPGPLVAGVFSYDFLGCYETLPPARVDPTGWPDYEFWLPDRMVWLNHKKRTATVVAFVFGGARATETYNDAIESVARTSAAIENLPAGTKSESGPAVTVSMPPAEVSVDMSDQEYAELVALLKQHIVAGDVFQIVASRTFSTACTRPLNAYRKLRDLNPSPYMFLVNSQSGVLFGASPETAVRVDGDPPRIQIRPIAGTRPRGLRKDGSIDQDLDSRLEAELRLDRKENAEHMMLVDLARNDVARVSSPGTRWVEKLLGVDRYSHVMHLVSYVSGELRPELDGLSAYIATMNMGTLVGAPKIKAAQLLRTYEPSRRGPYGGAVGYYSSDGTLDSSIVIRSAVVRDGTAHVRAGAGIVYDSDPATEALETSRKVAAVLEAVQRSEREVS